MADSKTLLHLLGRDIAWEESWYILSLAAFQARHGPAVVVAAPKDSWAGKNAPAFAVEYDDYALGSPLNPLEWRRLGSLAQKSGATAVHAHGRLAATMLSRSRLPNGCRRAASVYAPPVSPHDGFIAKADCVFAASHFAGGPLLEPADTAACLAPCGVDPEAAKTALARRDAERAALKEKFCPDKDKPLFIGSFAPFEEGARQKTLLEAMPEIVARLPQVHLLLAGDGPLFPELERQCRIMALDDHVTFLETDPDVLGILATLDVYMALRETDPACVMLQAAMSVGRAVVTIASGACPEFVEDGKTGIIADANSPDGIAGAVLDLLQNRNRREHLGRLAAAKALKASNLELTAKIMADSYGA